MLRTSKHIFNYITENTNIHYYIILLWDKLDQNGILVSRSMLKQALCWMTSLMRVCQRM